MITKETRGFRLSRTKPQAVQASLTDESHWSKAQPRGISRSMPRKKNGLALSTQKMYIKSTSHCLIFYQCIVGELYTIISEDKVTQSEAEVILTKIDL